MRRTIARYLVVALIQTLRCIDVKVGQVYPRSKVIGLNLGEEKISYFVFSCCVVHSVLFSMI